MKKIILLLLVSFGLSAQQKIKYKQMENPATSSVNIGTQTFSVSTITGSITMGTGTVVANTTTLGAVRIKQGSSYLDLGENAAGEFCMWGNQSPNAATNYLIKQSGPATVIFNTTSDMRFNGSNNIIARFQAGSTSFYTTYKTTIGSSTLGSATLNVVGNVSVSTTFTNAGNFLGQSSITSSSKTSGIGYAVGSGSTVTQATSRTTSVVCNSATGQITLVSAAGSTSWQTFTVSSTAVAVNDVIIINQKSGTDLNEIHITAIAAGSFNITFRTTGGTTVEQPVFSYAVIKGQSN